MQISRLFVHFRAVILCVVAVAATAPLPVAAAPYAAMVVDARSGEVLHSRNADTRLHPASLTKMMTLYVAFEAVENGEISLDTMVTISSRAAAEPPSKLGLRSGQKIKFRYLIRAAAVKSANDAASAIGEAIEGSEAAFARRMNRTAKALGMNRTTFKNAHGLTESGHLSTARDMTTLGRHLFYDYPDYYNLFSRISTDAGIKTVQNTNRRFLGSYKGADGIKTGYTRAAGFNLVASAERGRERIITTVFGGRSTATRNAKVAELMDLGFKRAPTRVATREPQRPAYQGKVADNRPASGKTIRVSKVISKSPHPKARPIKEADPELLIAMQDGIADAMKEAIEEPVKETEVVVAEAPKPAPKPQPKPEAKVEVAELPQEDSAPEPKPVIEPAPVVVARATPTPVPLTPASADPRPAPRPQVTAFAPQPDEGQEVVARVSTSGGRNWGISIGKYPSRFDAERELLQTALKELSTLDDALRKVNPSSTGFEANFVGLSQSEADLTCRRLQARGSTCTVVGPRG